MDVPDISGFGKITRAGNVWMKTTNIGVIGNPFTSISSDPSCQWPGPSGVEYLFYVGLWVGAVDPTTVDPARRRRVSAATEWRPRSLDPADRIYEVGPDDAGGKPYQDDDGDGQLDEDPKNGFDDDGDGQVDEDGSNFGDQGFNCVMRDDQPLAIQQATQEAHVPLGLQVRQSTFAFSGPDLRDVAYVSQEVENVSGHELDSVYVAYLVDQDVGPVSEGRFFADDIPEPQVPQGPDPTLDPSDWNDPTSPNAPYKEIVSAEDPKFQGSVSGTGQVTGLCPVDTIFVRGFTMTDDDGDGGKTPGASTFLLLDHPHDLTGTKAPPHVGFHMYNYYTPGLTFAQGGLPTNDLERYEVISSPENVDPKTGLITARRPSRAGDYSSICSVGPFLHMNPGERIKVVWAMAVQKENRAYERDDRRHRYGSVISNAVAAELGYLGTYQVIPLIPSPDGPGRETPLRSAPGQEYVFGDCHDLAQRPFPNLRDVTSRFDTWFDLDCNYCTGVAGHVLRHWVTGHPPPNANTHLAPEDHKVLVQWDNYPEYSPDPDQNTFDFAGYRVWKASSWKRPNQEIGPDESLWELLGTYYYYGATNPLVEKQVLGPGDTLIVKTSDVLVNRAWVAGNPLPRVIPAKSVPCLPGSGGAQGAESPGAEPCDFVTAQKHVIASNGADSVITNYPVRKYSIGRWQLEDPLVLNGFVYFYSVTAFDSSGRGPFSLSLEGRRAALQNEAVVPQSSFDPSMDGGRTFVVPNPYRGSASWDLAPNATDPTGKHVDFMNLPKDWSLVRIYTLSGDLVQEIRPGDVRVDGHPQKETPTDQEATWNLLSRNGQDVVSGIYLFSVETQAGKRQQGRFVIIR